MTRRSAAGAFGAIVIGAAAVLAQSPIPGLVAVDVVVEDAGGRPVGDLTTGDFEIESDGVRLPIQSFAVGTPLSLLAVFDRSFSTSRLDPAWFDPTTDSMLDKLVEWLSLRASSSMRIRPAGVANALRLSPAFATDRRSLVASAATLLTFLGADRAGPSPLVDAMDDAVRSLMSVAGRRAIVLLSDGKSTGNHHGSADIARRAAIAGVTVSVVLLFPLPKQVGVRSEHLPVVEVLAALHPSTLWQPFAERTGGTCVVVKEPRDHGAEPALAQVFALLERTYTLGFSPAIADGGFHPLTVRVTRPGLRVRARSGYEAK